MTKQNTSMPESNTITITVRAKKRDYLGANVQRALERYNISYSAKMAVLDIVYKLPIDDTSIHTINGNNYHHAVSAQYVDGICTITIDNRDIDNQPITINLQLFAHTAHTSANHTARDYTSAWYTVYTIIGMDTHLHRQSYDATISIWTNDDHTIIITSTVTITNHIAIDVHNLTTDHHDIITVHNPLTSHADSDQKTKLPPHAILPVICNSAANLYDIATPATAHTLNLLYTQSGQKRIGDMLSSINRTRSIQRPAHVSGTYTVRRYLPVSGKTTYQAPHIYSAIDTTMPEAMDKIHDAIVGADSTYGTGLTHGLIQSAIYDEIEDAYANACKSVRASIYADMPAKSDKIHTDTYRDLIEIRKALQGKVCKAHKTLARDNINMADIMRIVNALDRYADLIAKYDINVNNIDRLIRAEASRAEKRYASKITYIADHRTNDDMSDAETLDSLMIKSYDGSGVDQIEEYEIIQSYLSLLTPRQQQIAKLSMAGYGTNDIAKKMDSSAIAICKQKVKMGKTLLRHMPLLRSMLTSDCDCDYLPWLADIGR